MEQGRTSERGAASVEQAGITALIALALLAAIAALAAEGEIEPGRDLARAIERRIACAPRLPGPCRRHPLVPAYVKKSRWIPLSPGARLQP